VAFTPTRWRDFVGGASPRHKLIPSHTGVRRSENGHAARALRVKIVTLGSRGERRVGLLSERRYARPMADLERVLKQLHDSEINAGVQTFYDTGMRTWIGDESNGIQAETTTIGRAVLPLRASGRKESLQRVGCMRSRCASIPIANMPKSTSPKRRRSPPRISAAEKAAVRIMRKLHEATGGQPQRIPRQLGHCRRDARTCWRLVTNQLSAFSDGTPRYRDSRIPQNRHETTHHPIAFYCNMIACASRPDGTGPPPYASGRKLR